MLRLLISSFLLLATTTTSWAFPNVEVLGLRRMPVNKKWVLALQDGKLDEQIQAAELVGQHGPKAALMIPALIQAFESTDQPQLKITIARALNNMGPLAKSAVPMLYKEFQSLAGYSARDYAFAIISCGDGTQTDVLRWFLLNNSEGRSKSTTTIRYPVEKHPMTVLPALADMLNEGDSRWAYRILRGLRVGIVPRDPKSPALISMLNGEQRQHILMQLRQYFTTNNSVVNTMNRYQAADLALRMEPRLYRDVIPLYMASARLTMIDRNDFAHLLSAHPESPLIVMGYFTDPNPTFRNNLVASFRDIDTPDVRQAIIAGLKHHHPLVREGTVNILRYHGTLTREIRPLIMQRLDDSNPRVRLLTATLINDIELNGQGSVDTLPALMKLLDEKDRVIRNRALGQLLRMGKKSQPALPALMRLVRHSDVETRFLAADALMNIDRTTAASCVNAFIAMTKSEKHTDYVEKAVIRLGDCGTLAKAALPTLRTLNDTHTARSHAAFAMWRIDPQTTDEALELLGRTLNVNDSEPLTTMDYLVKMGTPARRLIPQLSELMANTDDDDDIASKAASVIIQLDPKNADEAYHFFRSRLTSTTGVPYIWFERLQELGPLAKPLIPEILVAAQSKRHTTRRHAINALGELGQHSKDALPALREAAKIEGNTAMVNEAIRKIENAAR